MEYKIINFNQDKGQVTLRFESDTTYPDCIVDLPIDSNNRIPEGEELKSFLAGFVPEAYDNRLKKIALNGIANPNAITIATVPEAEKIENLAQEVRTTRDDLLTACDWTQIADAPLTPEEVLEWKEFRGLLRDIPQQKGFPTELYWPVSPDTDIS